MRISSCLLAVASRPVLQRVLRRDAEAEQHFAQQLFDREEWIENQRRERRRIELLENRPAEGRLAGTDVAREDDEAFLAADRLPDLLQCDVVRFASIQKARIRRQAERRLDEPVILLVHALVGKPSARPAWARRLLKQHNRKGLKLPSRLSQAVARTCRWSSSAHRPLAVRQFAPPVSPCAASVSHVFVDSDRTADPRDKAPPAPCRRPRPSPPTSMTCCSSWASAAIIWSRARSGLSATRT